MTWTPPPAPPVSEAPLRAHETLRAGGGGGVRG